MARKTEERKRGKKRRKVNVEKDSEPAVKASEGFFFDTTGNGPAIEVDEQAPPSWLVEKEGEPSTRAFTDSSTPFGLVDVDLKAYLRTAHIKLQELIDSAVEENRSILQDDEVKTLRNAMLDEVKGKELTLATDSDTSRILEDMIHTFSQRQTRILADSLASSSEDLYKVACHRFGSHLVQTVLLGLQVAIASESQVHSANGKRKEAQGKVFDGSGKELRSAQQLIIDCGQSLVEHAPAMLSDQFGTHVLRTLLLVFAGRASEASDLALRSKRSRTFRQKTQGVKTAKDEHSAKVDIAPTGDMLHGLHELLSSITRGVEAEKVKSLSMDPVASPTLTLIIELSAIHDATDGRESLLSLISDGLDGSTPGERSNFVEELIRDSVGSHLIQRLAQTMGEETVTQFWATYIEGRLCKLGTHPIANFVLAAVLRRLGEEDGAFAKACQEIELAGDSLIKNERMGILIALCDRAHELSRQHPDGKVAPNATRKRTNVPKSVWTDARPQSLASRAVMSAFGFVAPPPEKADEGIDLAVLVSGKTRKAFAKEQKRGKKDRHSKETADTADEAVKAKQAQQQQEDESRDAMQVSMQGSLLCQSLLRLPEPGNTPLLDALLALPSLLPLASNAITVHIVLAPLLPTAGTTFAQRTSLANRILLELAPLMGDKFGSRVIDALFDTSDAYFKEKIMARCLDQEGSLLTSNFGRYFLKRTNVALFRKNVGQWKQWLKGREAQQHQKVDLAPADELVHANGDGSASVAEAKKTERPEKRKVDEELDNILAVL